MKRVFFLLSSFFLCNSVFAHIQDFATIPAQPLSHGVMSFGARAEFYRSKNLFDIPLSGDLLIGPVFVLISGFGNIAEFRLEWDGYRYLMSDPNFGSSGDLGDPSFFAKIRLLTETTWPAMSISFGAKEPLTSDETHVGTDNADIFAVLHFTKSFSKIQFHGNAGIGIYGNRNLNAAQKDAWMYALLLEGLVGEGFAWGVEFSGQYYKNNDALNRMAARLGVQKKIGAHWYVNLVSSLGLKPQSESWGVIVGFYHQSQVF